MRAQRRAVVAGLLVAAAGWGIAGCGSDVPATSDVAGGDPRRGRDLAAERGCSGCHVIPGVRDATGRVGPPLDGVGARAYLAGLLVNTPENMVRWVRSPQEVQPGNPMPDLGLTEQEARDIAAYLRALR